MYRPKSLGATAAEDVAGEGAAHAATLGLERRVAASRTFRCARGEKGAEAGRSMSLEGCSPGTTNGTRNG